MSVLNIHCIVSVHFCFGKFCMISPLKCFSPLSICNAVCQDWGLWIRSMLTLFAPITGSDWKGHWRFVPSLAGRLQAPLCHFWANITISNLLSAEQWLHSRWSQALKVISLNFTMNGHISHWLVYMFSDRPFDFRCLFLTTARVQLFHRIDARCELIIKQGLFPVSYIIRCAWNGNGIWIFVM